MWCYCSAVFAFSSPFCISAILLPYLHKSLSKRSKGFRKVPRAKTWQEKCLPDEANRSDYQTSKLFFIDQRFSNDNSPLEIMKISWTKYLEAKMVADNLFVNSFQRKKKTKRQKGKKDKKINQKDQKNKQKRKNQEMVRMQRLAIIYLSTGFRESAQWLRFPSSWLFWIRNPSNPSGERHLSLDQTLSPSCHRVLYIL